MHSVGAWSLRSGNTSRPSLLFRRLVAGFNLGLARLKGFFACCSSFVCCGRFAFYLWLPWGSGEFRILFGRRSAVIKVCYRSALQGSVQRPFDGADHDRILAGHQGKRVAAPGGPAGPSDAVNVSLGGIGNIVVDDM